MKVGRMKIIKIILDLIPHRKARSFLKRYVFDEDFRKEYQKERENKKRHKMYEKQNNKSFVGYNIPDHTVLIVEPNPYHGEILPGFVKYFYDLGYNVDLMLRHENDVEDIFCRFDKKPNVFYGTANHLKEMLKWSKIKDYEYLFFSSSAFWERDYANSYLNFLEFEPQTKKGILMIEHNIDPYLHEYQEEKYLDTGRLFTLSGFHNTPMLNPHYFGDNISITPKSDDKTRFIAVGGINSACKNHELLLKAVRSLVDLKIKFEVIVVGSGKLDLPVDLQKFVIFKGRLDFKNMFAEMEKADFFLPLLDATIPEHKRYMTGTTTGSRQLALGFLKPMIIAEEFAQVYDLNNQNSVVYSQNDLTRAMLVATKIEPNHYANMQRMLKKLADEIYQRSLDNLRKTVGE